MFHPQPGCSTEQEAAISTAGYRFLATDWLALHADVRDHLFDMDLLGAKRTTNNIEITLGATVFF